MNRSQSEASLFAFQNRMNINESLASLICFDFERKLSFFSKGLRLCDFFEPRVNSYDLPKMRYKRKYSDYNKEMSKTSNL